MTKNRFILGTVVGAIAGVVAGVLTAPKSGEETREDLKAKANEVKDETARRVQSVQDAKKPIDALVQQAEDLLHRDKK